MTALYVASNDVPPGVHDQLVQAGKIALGEQVRGREADLLVLGTHGGGSMREAFVGSTSMTFLKLPPCDVAVVKAR